jgi:hypothetical protein
VDWTQFRNAIIEARDAIPQEKIDSLIRSMPRRLHTVHQAKGWYTKYYYYSLF